MIELRPEQEQVVNKLNDTKSALIVAETGSGKTVIALKMIDQFLKSNVNERVLYIAPTNILTTQHAQSSYNLISHPTYLIKSNVKKPCLDNKGLYITTAHYAKILCKNLPSDYYAMIVYDESHKAITSTSPYTYIANHFKPQVNYGFTASPGKDCNLKLILKNLKISDVIYASTSNRYMKTTNLIPVTNPINITKKYELYCNWLRIHFSTIYSVLNLPTRNLLSYLIKNKAKFTSLLIKNNIPLYRYYVYFQLYYCGYLYYYEGYDTFLEYYLKIQKYNLKKYKMFNLLLEEAYTNEKFKLIYELCVDHPTTTLVFFENYSTAIACKKYLCGDDFNYEEIQVLAGKSKINAKVRDEIVKKTHENKVKILLATSVVQEGVDIQGVDQIIFYRPISNKIRIIQRRGRTGRHRDGVINILYYKNTEEKSYV